MEERPTSVDTREGQQEHLLEQLDEERKSKKRLEEELAKLKEFQSLGLLVPLGPGICLGLCVGMMVGMSQSPTVGTAIVTVASFATVFAGFKGSAAITKLAAAFISAFALSLTLGVVGGVACRTHGCLSPTKEGPEQEDPMTDAAADASAASEASEKVPPTSSPDASVLYNERKSDCDELTSKVARGVPTSVLFQRISAMGEPWHPALEACGKCIKEEISARCE